MSRTKNGRAVARTVEIVILFALPILVHYLFPVLTVVTKPYTSLGLTLMIPAIALATWVAKTFRKVGTSYQLHGESSVLTTSGPFRISRNPMYLAMVIWLFGLAVLLGSLTAFMFPVLLFLAANFLIIPPEERNMEQVFRDQYAEYKQSVRRWV